MTHKWQPVGKELNWLLVDFDDTIAHSTGFPDFIPTTPLDGASLALHSLRARGYQIIIYTARHWADHVAIERWCRHFGIPFDGVICGKPLGYRIIDDKNIEFQGNWFDVLKKLEV